MTTPETKPKTNPTLLREVQSILESTYGPTGLNLEDFLLDHRRNQQLLAMTDVSMGQVSDLGRVFLRHADGQLRMGIYFDHSVITALEQDNPQYGLNDRNVLPFMVFLEETDHAVHAALKFLAGDHDIHSELFVRDLELQAKVDTYLILQKYCAFFNPDHKLTEPDRRWLKACVFDAEKFAYEAPHLRQRYHETNRLARRYVKYLDGLPAKNRTTEIRKFRKLDYRRKQKRIASSSL
jgi:hypothetical protein